MSYTNHRVVITAGGGGVEGCGERYRGINGDLTWGGEHTIQCTDDVLWNCAPETCTLLLTSVTSMNSTKKQTKGLCTAYN